MKVAVLGIGLMGYRMTQRLLEAGHEVHVWNRTHERALPLADHASIAYAADYWSARAQLNERLL